MKISGKQSRAIAGLETVISSLSKPERDERAKELARLATSEPMRPFSGPEDLRRRLGAMKAILPSK